MSKYSEKSIPTVCDVLVIGGGPAGSSAATHLAQSGIDVVLLERAAFPRNQVGESLIPHFWKFTDLTGVTEKICQEGFVSKSGGITVWDNQIRQISFAKFGYSRPGLHVERDVFDNILLDHAQSCGAQVYTRVAVKKADFSDTQWPKIIYTDKRGENNSDGIIRCRYVIDASGHSSLLAKQFKTRQTVSSKLNFLSLWGYYKNSRYVGIDRLSHPPEASAHVKPVTFVMSYADGWIWHIILREKTSVGLIVHTDRTRGMTKDQLTRFYQQTCNELPYLKNLLAPSSFISDSMRFRPDYSYYSSTLCAENYYCIGDAAAFVDPIFSHGVQNALYNAATAALAVKESLKNANKRARFSQLCESRMQQFYSFSRALSLGDYGCNGVHRNLVINLMKTIPPLELELILVASEMTNRSENFRQIAREAGVLGEFSENFSGEKLEQIESLDL